MERISFSITVKTEMFDVDLMNVMWHGNYIRLLETARRALLDEIGYGYIRMKDDGYAYPVVRLDMKYIYPAFFGDDMEVTAELLEYIGLLKIGYTVKNITKGKISAKGSTAQAAVDIASGETCYRINKEFLNQIEAYLDKNK